MPTQPIYFYRRHLPHWRQDGATYVVTLRLADALPQNALRALKFLREDWEANHPEPRSEADWKVYAARFTKAANRYLDEGHGSCVLGRTEFAELCGHSIRHFNVERYELISYVVMPNHWHVIIRPFNDWKLEELLGGMKKFVGLRINGALGQEGKLFQEESYDRIVRDVGHLWDAVQYVGANSRKAGLNRGKWYRWLSPQWRELGWCFEDEREAGEDSGAGQDAGRSL